MKLEISIARLLHWMLLNGLNTNSTFEFLFFLLQNVLRNPSPILQIANGIIFPLQEPELWKSSLIMHYPFPLMSHLSAKQRIKFLTLQPSKALAHSISYSANYRDSVLTDLPFNKKFNKKATVHPKCWSLPHCPAQENMTISLAPVLYQLHWPHQDTWFLYMYLS